MAQYQTGQGGASNDVSDVERLYKEARYYLKRREPNMAAHVLNRALEANPSDPRFLSCLGLCKAMVNRRSNEALELCEKALAFGAYGDFFYCNLGKVHLLRGSKQKAYAAFQAGLKTNSRNKDILQALHEMGIRRKPLVSFLPRGHFVNRFAGRMRNMMRRSAV